MTVVSDDSSDTGSGIADKALVYSRYGLRIFPVHAVEKRPMPGYGWVELASSATNHVVEDFTRAIELWGDQVSVAWALGLDGYMAVDVDVDEHPAWLSELVTHAAISQTKRGIHLIFKMPGFDCGNGTSKFPSQDWGEVRGKGGYVVVAGPDRVGLDIADLAHAAPFPYPNWLSEYGGKTDVATKEEVIAFANEHPGPGSRPNKLDSIRAACDGWNPRNEGDPRKGRHPFAIWVTTAAAEDALDGYYGFAEAVLIIKDWWKRVTPPDRHGREFDGIVTWAVGKAWANAGVAPSPTDDETQDEAPSLSLVEGITPLLDPSFHPVDLEGVLDGTFIVPTPSILRRDDDRQALFYRGQVNGVHGDSGTGKGWVALYAAAQQLRAGNTVMLLDLEDVPSSIVDRLRKMHVADDAIRERLIYIRPSSNFDRVAIEHLVAIVEARHPTLVIIDSLGEAFGLEGIDENHDSEVGPWLRAVPRRLADTGNGEEGPAVVILDHVTKVNDIPLHPSGSKRKRAAIGGAQYWAHSVVPFDAQTGGRLRLKCAKDRHGNFRRGEDVGDLVIKVDPIIGSWEATLYSPNPVDDSPQGKITRVTDKVVDALRLLGKPTSFNALCMTMGGRKSDVRAAIDVAVDNGLIRDEKVGNKSVISLTEWQ